MYSGAEGGGLPGPTLYPALHETHTEQEIRAQQIRNLSSKISPQNWVFSTCLPSSPSFSFPGLLATSETWIFRGLGDLSRVFP